MIEHTKTAAVVIGIMGSLWAAGDYLDVRPIIEKEYRADGSLMADRLGDIQTQIAGLGDSVLILKFQALLAKLKQNGSLTFDEQQTLCQYAKQLQYTGVPGCPNY